MYNDSIFHIEEIISIPSKVRFLRQINDELILVVDSDMILYKVHAKEYKIYDQIQLDLPKDEVTSIVADNKNEFIYSLKGGGLFIYDINNHNKKPIDTIINNDVVDIRFSRDGQYFVVKYTNSHLSIFDNKLKKFIYTIQKQSDAKLIKHFFSLDSQILVLIHEDGSVVVFDTFTHSKIATYSITGHATDGFVYDDNTKIFITTVEGEHAFSSFNLISKTLTTTTSSLKNAVSCYTDKTHTTAICGTTSGMVFLINLQTLEVITTFVFDSSTSKVFINDNLIVILLDNNQIYFFDKNYNLSQALIKLELKEFKSAFELISQNIFLYMNPKVLEHLNNAWEELYKRALHFIGEDKESLALRMLEPFFAIKSKKDIYNYVIQNKQYAIDFNNAVKERDLKTAYDIAKEYEFLQHSLNYMKLEESWDEAFMKAEKLLSSNVQADQILTITKPYLEINQKYQIISEMIKNADLFLKAAESIKNRQFYLFYKYCEKFPSLKISTFGRKADELGQKLYEKLLQTPRNSSEFESLIEYLKHFPEFKTKVEAIKTESAIEQMFTKAKNDDNIKLIYHLIHANPFLKSTKTYRQLIADTEKDFQIFTAVVYEKGFESSYKTISKYFSIDMLYHKIFDYMKLYYMLQIKTLPKEQLSKALFNYKRLFGEDDILMHLSKHFLVAMPQATVVKQLQQKFHPSILQYD
ncbi:WD40 repeat domain-containing protein [Arcobacter sp. FWKO B]|uniref:WD40 repeat domain-containing protein n=1 Tax=Arcobacter sp. FWKO B TaxID=2593672 RepID=UPI0018A5D500|nr:WD40 repeat domain-containing protein [Arcobacter sp. FWKO B]QOG11582.1 WD40 repeat domain-containing protein [Arcobacter sp. FWKO B]